MCSDSHGKRWYFKENGERMDFGGLTDCIRSSSRDLCTSKQFVADILQESRFTYILNAEPDKNIFHCLVYIYHTEVSFSTAPLSIIYLLWGLSCERNCLDDIVSFQLENLVQTNWFLWVLEPCSCLYILLIILCCSELIAYWFAGLLLSFANDLITGYYIFCMNLIVL